MMVRFRTQRQYHCIHDLLGDLIDFYRFFFVVLIETYRTEVPNTAEIAMHFSLRFLPNSVFILSLNNL